MNLVRYIVDAVNRYWADDVQILAIWDDGPGACIVYRRTIDPTKVLGGKFEFRKDSADGTIEGYARDIAVNLAEPIGRAATRRDQHGIFWLSIPEDCPTPELPGDVSRKVAESWQIERPPF